MATTWFAPTSAKCGSMDEVSVCTAIRSVGAGCPAAGRHAGAASPAAAADKKLRRSISTPLLRADPLVPHPERHHHPVRRQRQLDRVVPDQGRVFVPPE